MGDSEWIQLILMHYFSIKIKILQKKTFMQFDLVYNPTLLYSENSFTTWFKV